MSIVSFFVLCSNLCSVPYISGELLLVMCERRQLRLTASASEGRCMNGIIEDKRYRLGHHSQQ